MPTKPTKSSRRWLVWSLRILVLVVVFGAVSGTVRTAVEQLSHHEWHVRPAWLVAAGALYIIGLLPMAWFWDRTLVALSHPTPWAVTLRAYFLGHLGKYVPGKAMSVILRVAAIRRWAPSLRLAMLSTMLETLTMMAVGAFLAAVLSVFLLRSRPEYAAVALMVAIGVGVPTFPPVARWFARFGANRLRQRSRDTSATIHIDNVGGVSDADHGTKPNAKNTPTPNRGQRPLPQNADALTENIDDYLRGINTRLLFEGWIAAAACWVFLGWSLAATLRAIGIDTVEPLSDLPMLVAAVAMAVVAGFVSMLPGGLGVRDLALVQILSETCGPADALVAAVMMRLVWLMSEVAVCVILYIAAKVGNSRSLADG